MYSYSHMCLLQTPVHLAAGNSQLECLHALLDFGGSHECKDDEGNIPLDYAQNEGHNLCVHLLTKFSGELHCITCDVC